MTKITWRKPARCETAACVEIAITANGDVLVRDSKNPDGPHLTWPAADWKAFCNNVRHGWTPTQVTFAPLNFSPAELAALTDDIRHPQPVDA
jgi:hypothetical protein